MTFRFVWPYLAGALLLVGCRTVPTLPDETLRELRSRPDAHLVGEVKGLGDLGVLNDQDFIYTAAWSPDGTRIAGTRLGGPNYSLQIFAVPQQPVPRDFEEGGKLVKPVVEVEVNPTEFDVESLVFSPDGKTVAAASRDTSVRLYEVATGKLLAATQLEHPLTVVAFHPSGRYLAVGDTQGTLSLLEAPGLAFSNEVRAHAGELRGLSFTRDGRLFSGGWDKTLAIFEVHEQPLSAGEARLRYETKGSFSTTRGQFGERVVLTFALDSREPLTLIRSEVARAAGLEPSSLQETIQLTTAMGQVTARLARGRTLTFKGLRLEKVDVAICDACIPPEVQGVLGQSFFDRVEARFEPEASTVVLTRKPVEGNEASPARPGLTLQEKVRHVFPWHLNDFTVDAKGERVGVAFSETPAIRTREIYQREKKGLAEPKREGNTPALVDAASGKILKTWPVHAGIVSTAAISPDGRTLASGGWDKTVRVLNEASDEPIATREFGWSVRRVRFSPDARFLGVAAWTPQNAVGSMRSDPAFSLFTLQYGPGVGVSQ